MKQRTLPILEVKVNRKCQFGACDKDLAYVINGIDLCFAHGRTAIEFELAQGTKTNLPGMMVQLEIK